MSLAKHLKPLVEKAPRPVINWDKHERIKRNQEIWDNKDSVVHRLPRHYQMRYWKNVLSDRTPVHYRPPQHRFYWDEYQVREVETEDFPILPQYTPEQDQSLWGGEGVIKGFKESRPFLKKKVLPRQWIPHLFFPVVKEVVLYSEILDKHMRISVTERTMRLIEKAFGFDLYLLETSDLDLNSKLGWELKSGHLLIALAKNSFAPMIQINTSISRRNLNSACRKQQDLEDGKVQRPLKHVFEEELLKKCAISNA
uniref:Large ribosomal subunit protein bL28m n=1 Tax=Ditylenchus dipsaci TaxID=166011 RepID=A0A915EMI8_9BILA